MRKFAMTLLLGLGMATASFAGNVETAEAKAEMFSNADIDCVWFYPSCGGGPVRVCGSDAFLLDKVMRIEADRCG